MSKTYDIKKLGGDKIALLGLFALSLLTARFVVGLRATLVLSEPIPLPGTGLAVSMPVGNGWQIQGGWARDGKSFAIGSSFSAGPAEETAGVLCRYQPARGTATAQLRFEQKAREFNGGIVEMDRKGTDLLIFDWARVEGNEMPSTAFLATTVLPDGWLLDIEVYEISGDAEQAEQAFHRVIESVRFDDGRPRTAARSTTWKQKGSS